MIQLIAPRTIATGVGATTPPQAVPAGLHSILLQLDAPVSGATAPFTNPAQHISGELDLSYDGGTTWVITNTSDWFGQSTWTGTAGGWGKDGTAPPTMGVVFSPDRYPTHLRLTGNVISGPVTLGLSFETA